MTKTPPEYRIEAIWGPDYVKDIARMQLECFPDDAPLDPRNGGWWFLVKARFGYPVGFAALQTLFTREGVKGYLSRSGVIEKHRGKGLQKRLIKAREAVARRHRFPSVVCTTFENGPSGNSLIACGYKLWEPEDPWMANGTNYWIKRLGDGK